jgi:hypothetical protein
VLLYAEELDPPDLYAEELEDDTALYAEELES